MHRFLIEYNIFSIINLTNFVYKKESIKFVDTRKTIHDIAANLENCCISLLY